MRIMTKKERVLRTIARKEIDYLPSNVYFASPDTKLTLQKAFTMDSADALDTFLENHLQITSTMDDIFRFRGDHPFLKKAEKTIFARVDWEKGILHDRWGVGYDINTDGICVVEHPLRGASDEEIMKYQAPSPDVPGNYAMAEEEIKKFGAEYLMIMSGYGGIFERAWFLLGYEELLMGLASNSKPVTMLLEKILEYKISVAKKTIAMGFEIGHTGDDVGGQTGLMFSIDMWAKHFRPLYRKLWGVFKDAGLPIMHHSCGCITDMMGEFIDLGLDCIEPVQNVMDFALLKKKFGNKLTFWGGIGTQSVLPFGTPQEVRDQTRHVVETLGRGGGLIIAPDQEIMADVPPANMVAYVETVREYRAKVL
jgi:uroporphyrinogen decarboxylase